MVIPFRKVTLAVSVIELSCYKYFVCWICKCEGSHLSQGDSTQLCGNSGERVLFGKAWLTPMKWGSPSQDLATFPSEVRVCCARLSQRRRSCALDIQANRSEAWAHECPPGLRALVYLTSQCLHIKLRCWALLILQNSPMPCCHLQPAFHAWDRENFHTSIDRGLPWD